MCGLTLLTYMDISNTCLAESDAGLDLAAVTLSATSICAGSESQLSVLFRNSLLAAGLCKSQINAWGWAWGKTTSPPT